MECLQSGHILVIAVRYVDLILRHHWLTKKVSKKRQFNIINVYMFRFGGYIGKTLILQYT